MRTPNTECCICDKPLYRRAFELAKIRYVACIEHRYIAQRAAGVTDAQNAALKLGRPKGTNHRTGYKHKEASKIQTAEANRAFWAANPAAAIARGEKMRGELHGNWKGGLSRLNISIRQMTENRRWMDAVKVRDGACLRCGSIGDLESHHIIELATLIESCGVKSRADARNHAAILWDLTNGETLCRPCHWIEHDRKAA